MNFRLRVPLLLLFIIGVAAAPAMAGPCTVPNAITNGQVADASKVMDNINAVATCAQQAVTTTGAPTTGAIPVFSGAGSITGGNLTGDVTTSGGTATALSNTGVVSGLYTNATINVDSKGRLTYAAAGTPSGGGSDWINLTFGTPASTRWGSATVFKADQTPDLSTHHKIEILIAVKHSAGSAMSISLSPDGQSCYQIAQQGDNNAVLYRYSNATGSAGLLAGGSSYYSSSGTVEIGLTIWVGSTGTTNAVEGAVFGPVSVKFASDSYSNVPLSVNGVGIYIQVDGNNLSNIAYAKYRVE